MPVHNLVGSTVHHLAWKIPERVAKPIEFEERQLRIGASVGYSYDRADQTEPDKLLISSDIALYQAKDLGRGNASTSGCEIEDFAGFTAGNIALIQRGACSFQQKAENAEASGAPPIRVARSSAVILAAIRSPSSQPTPSPGSLRLRTR